MKAGIVGYGAYVPHFRIKSANIAKIWGVDPESIVKLVGEKTVPDLDEDSATMAVTASRIALARAGINPIDIGAVYIGSESHPYVVKSTSAIVAEAIGATPVMTAADLEFACKAGTAGFQAVMGLIKSGYIKYGLAIGSDTSQGRPGDALEYTAAAGCGAYIFGAEDIIATVNDFCSYTTDTPDFWRREGEDFPRHGGRFTGEPGYFNHVLSATRLLLEKTGTDVKDYDYFIFHQPNAKFPVLAAKKLGIEKEKVLPGLLVPKIGNTYSAAVPLGLAAVLDIAKPGDRILATSFGSGAGSDSFSITVEEGIEENRNRGTPLNKFIDDKAYLTYADYLKHRRKIKGVQG
ncbi:MAG: hydroxymethylglutaryl-CoA synthase [Candidatus Aenigmarchaeota archaeon]|nr:hydroxymethylglutaryl-CoA synthase [Candidatus Aenigmarchaeota archaeon]